MRVALTITDSAAVNYSPGVGSKLTVDGVDYAISMAVETITIPMTLGDTETMTVTLTSNAPSFPDYVFDMPVYGYDIALPITVLTIAERTDPASSFLGGFVIEQKPCSADVYLAINSNDNFERVTWTVNGDIVGSGKEIIINHGNASLHYDGNNNTVSVLAEKGTWNNGAFTVTSSDAASTTFTLRQFECEIEYDVYQLEYESGCYEIDKDIEIRPILDIPSFAYTVDGVTAYLCANLQVVYTLYTEDDVEVATATETTPTSAVLDADLIYTFQVATKGVYYVTAEFTSCCVDCAHEDRIDLNIGNNYDVIPTSCTSYTFENNSLISYWIRVYEISIENYVDPSVAFPVPTSFLVGDSDSFIEVTTGSTESWTYPNDGAFAIQANTSDTETGCTTFIHHNFCAVRECYQSILVNTLCKDACCDECAEKDFYNLNKFNALYNLYFSYVDKEYKYTDTISGALSGSKVQEMFKLELVRNRVEKLCTILADCGCTETIDNLGDCGCN
jgi:hypothetical protein